MNCPFFQALPIFLPPSFCPKSASRSLAGPGDFQKSKVAVCRENYSDLLGQMKAQAGKGRKMGAEKCTVLLFFLPQSFWADAYAHHLPYSAAFHEPGRVCADGLSGYALCLRFPK
jgi:hypothetical protein